MSQQSEAPSPSYPLQSFFVQPKVSIAIGSFCLLAILINRLIDITAYASQGRADLLATLASAGLVLIGVALEDITAKEADRVELDAANLIRQAEATAADEQQEGLLRWASESLLRGTPYRSVVVFIADDSDLSRASIVLRHGYMGQDLSSVDLTSSPILRSAFSSAKAGISDAVCLQDLKFLPGRVELTYLPSNVPSVVMQPFTTSDGRPGVVVCGTNRPRSVTARHLAWTGNVAKALGLGLGRGRERKGR
ncbi:unnamed protein product [Vitrella brassicaformis CCMP3155]|uniref:GAF domain-containing protein n=1 Tax=Vitrella brassicaformis (strain CCMP3155) TaxID=1169540 RepID=A0A0G4EXS0_VITBC|nr:unnamed protein product [Vitrella brassicaformis CCMP3155]|eukprot:CEM04109.1 unnamed protein product [Vitrella brassicaformis CCMP3155]